ncbi:MAG TPA: tetratricopeptide repeat protein [Acidobacteriaceae bacterium]|nr:tetratricopeptide repeat protein [Acidobacteriaceae bacterium]
MPFFAVKTPLTAADRNMRRRLILTDSLSLVTLFAITALLAVLTNFLYQSYASHQVELANRWLQRGVQAMNNGKPQAAIDALSSALAFAPSDRDTEIKLAEALASAGRIQEATVYFNALLENQQGSGLINLQLARLAARQGNQAQAIEDYQKAIYGSWEGDGYVRRRDVRFELINYLITHNRLDQARNELLVASGNAPGDDISVQLEIARRMEQAQDTGDAFHIYRTLLHRHPSLGEALEGAGRTAFQMGRYLEAKRYLSKYLQTPGIDQEPAAQVKQSRDNLDEADRLLSLYPSSRLNPQERSARILGDRKLAMARLSECMQDRKSAPTEAVTKPNAPSTTGLANPLASLASHFARRPTNTAGSQQSNPTPVDPLAALQQRWDQLPPKMTAADLMKDPDLEQTQIQLIYDTEMVTQQVCGAPAGDDALLLRIAQAPNQVEEE